MHMYTWFASLSIRAALHRSLLFTVAIGRLFQVVSRSQTAFFGFVWWWRKNKTVKSGLATRDYFSRATNFDNGLKRKFEEANFTNLHWWCSRFQIAIFAQGHYRFRHSIPRWHHSLQYVFTCKQCTLRYGELGEIRFSVVNNSGMHVAWSFYALANHLSRL